MVPENGVVKVFKLELLAATSAQFKLREFLVKYYETQQDYDASKPFRVTKTSVDTILSPTYDYDQKIRATLPQMKPWQYYNVDRRTAIVRLTYGLLDFEAQPFYWLRTTAIESFFSQTVAMDVITNNFVELEHNLGYLPYNVKVRVAGAEGANNLFNFPGMGSVMVDGSEVKERYGGVLFAYNEHTIRLWAPSDATYGFIVNVNNGWGASTLQSSRIGNVNAQVHAGASPEYDSGWVAMASQSNQAQRDFSHNLGDLTYHIVKVLYRSADVGSPNYPRTEPFAAPGLVSASCTTAHGFRVGASCA